MLVVDSRHARKDHAAYRYDSCHRCKHLVKQIDACKGSTPANESLRSTSCGANKGPRSVPGPHSRPVVTSLVSASHANSVEKTIEREMVRVIKSPPGGADTVRTVTRLAASKEALDAIFSLVTAGLQFGFVNCGNSHLEITQAHATRTVGRGLGLELMPRASETQRSSGRSSCFWSCGVCWRDV